MHHWPSSKDIKSNIVLNRLISVLVLAFTFTFEFEFEFGSSRAQVRSEQSFKHVMISFSLLICFFLSLFFSFLFSFSCLFTDPPSAPIISGYVEGSIIPAGSVQKLVCISSGGNPLATLIWYKNDKKVGLTESLFVCIMCLAAHIPHLYIHTNIH